MRDYAAKLILVIVGPDLAHLPLLLHVVRLS
jgi:hypothetical protein